MRLFIAIDLPPEWKTLLAQIEHSIGWLGRGISWVKSRNIHLTLRFVGEVNENDLDRLRETIGHVCATASSFEMRMRGTGVFPNSRKPRVYWAGIDAPDQLRILQADIEKAVQSLSYEPETKAFSPHLTLARIKDPFGKERVTEALLNYQLWSEPILVQEVLLMRSHLHREGASYEVLARFPLSLT